MMTDTDPPGARSEPSTAPKLLVVGLGASAGGIQALARLLACSCRQRISLRRHPPPLARS